jgi:Flp pilus assembly protein TadD
MALGKLEDAEKDMDQVVALRPTADSFSNRGAMRSQRRRFAEAMDDYREALKLDPNNAGVHYNIGILKAREGKPADAVDPYRRAIELGRVQADGYIALAKKARRPPPRLSSSPRGAAPRTRTGATRARNSAAWRRAWTTT